MLYVLNMIIKLQHVSAHHDWEIWEWPVGVCIQSTTYLLWSDVWSLEPCFRLMCHMTERLASDMRLIPARKTTSQRSFDEYDNGSFTDECVYNRNTPLAPYASNLTMQPLSSSSYHSSYSYRSFHHAHCQTRQYNFCVQPNWCRTVRARWVEGLQQTNVNGIMGKKL